MTAEIRHVPNGVPSEDNYRIGEPVRAPEWRSIGQLLNTTRAKNRCVLPMTRIDVAGAVGISSTLTIPVCLFSSKSCTQRVWTISGINSSGGGPAIVTFTDPSGGAVARDVLAAPQDPFVTIEHLETRSSVVEGPETLTVSISVAALSSKTFTPAFISCYEIPAPSLSNADDLGFDSDTLAAGLGIRSGAAAFSLEPIAARMTLATNALKLQRRILMHALSPGAVSTTSGSYIVAYPNKHAVNACKLYSSDTVTPCRVYAYVRAGASTAGNVRITNAVGTTLVLAIPSGTAGGWINGTLNFSAEDVTQPDGRRGAAYESATIEIQRTSGANSVFLDAVAIADTR
jgi:hypothetical protein